MAINSLISWRNILPWGGGGLAKPDDPGMLLRMLPGVSNNRCCTDDKQPSKIAISLLGDTA
jgi:hypothetical protein